MKKYRILIMSVLAASLLGISGCSAKGAAAETQTQVETTQTQQAETPIVKPIEGEIEQMSQAGEQEMQELLRISGPTEIGEDGSLYMDNQSGVSFSGEIVIWVDPEKTLVLDGQTGLPFDLQTLEKGSFAYAYIGPAMTMSLPPKITGRVILCNVPEDAKAPDYVTVSSLVVDSSTLETVMTGADGMKFQVSDSCEFFPYLTRNIVTQEDLTPGTNCLVWSDEENVAQRIMIFAQ